MCSKCDDTHASVKVHQCQPQDQTISSSSSSLLKLEKIPLSSKFLTSKGVLVKDWKGSKTPLLSLKLSTTPSVVSDNTCKRKDHPTLPKNNGEQIPMKVLSKYNRWKWWHQLHGGWYRSIPTLKMQKRKTSDQSSRFADIDVVTI